MMRLKHVAADVVGAEQCARLGARQPDLGLGRERVVGREDIGEDGGEHEQQR